MPGKVKKEAVLYAFNPETQYTCGQCFNRQPGTNTCGLFGASDAWEPDAKRAELETGDGRLKAADMRNGTSSIKAEEVGHEFHGNQYAQAAGEAHAKGARATALGDRARTVQEHDAAAQAHREAARAHMAAKKANIETTGAGEPLSSKPTGHLKERSAQHNDRAVHHEQEAEFHEQQAKRLRAKGAGTKDVIKAMKLKIGTKIEHTGKKLTKEQLERGVAAKQEKTEEGHNPASWVEDESTWEKAKEAASKSYDESDDAFYPVVAHIYESMGGTVKSTQPPKAGSWREDAVRAAHGEVTGKPSFETLRAKVNQAIQEDPRWDTDKHGQPEGSPGDYEPWCVDILVPDDDGQLCAVIRTDDNRLVKHEFAWDGEEVKLAEGESQPVESMQVYAREVDDQEKTGFHTYYIDTVRYQYSQPDWIKAASHRREVLKAAGSADGAAKGHATRKSDRAADMSAEAHEASAKAHKSGDEDHHADAAEAHEAASGAHEAAYKAHAKHTGNEDAMDHHREHMKAHDAHAKAHATSAGMDHDEDHVESSDPDVVQCRASAAKFDTEHPPVSEFMWMPGGVSHITATYRGRPITMAVECDQDTAATVQASFEAHVKASPRRPPFGCVEHREEEATFHPKKFEWKEDPEPATYCTAEWTPLGVRNVRGKIHTSFSPSFTTDADYTKAVCAECRRTARACECDGELSFPDGVRGSDANPAQVTGVSHKSVGSLTNWPAFKNILPVRAKAPRGTGKAGAVGNVPVVGEVNAADPTPVLSAWGEFSRAAEAGYAPHCEGDTGEDKLSAAAHERSCLAFSEDGHKLALQAHERAAQAHYKRKDAAAVGYHASLAVYHKEAAAKAKATAGTVTMNDMGVIEAADRQFLALRQGQANKPQPVAKQTK